MLAIVGLLATSSAEAKPDADLEAEITRLRARLAAAPTDVDSRFALAQRLSWTGKRAEALVEARAVVAAAPTYWDAHVLVARIDGWNGQYADARARLAKVVSADPRHVDALTLAADIELWARDPKRASERADDLIAVADSAEARYRRARAAALEMSVSETRRWARRVLEADPEHVGARGLLQGAHLVRVIAASEFEVFPIEENAVALGQTILATVFPRSRWSASLGYDYRYRFGTDNHRAQVSAAHRLTELVDLDVLVRAGATKVVPELTASVGASVRVADYYTLGLRYSGDKMPWPGQLHRGIASATVGLPGQATVAATYEAGVLRYCGRSSAVQSVSLRGSIQHRWLTAGLLYAFGMELDRAPLDPFQESRFGDDVCAAGDMGQIDISLQDTRAQVIGAELGIVRTGRLSAAGGYTLNLRHAGERVHTSHLSLRFWF